MQKIDSSSKPAQKGKIMNQNISDGVDDSHQEHRKPEENKNQHQELFRSKTFIVTAAVLVELILLIGAFNLGLKVAFHKARFTYSWMSNYPKNFGMPIGPGPFMDHRPGDHEFMNASGVFGQIVSATGTTVTIKGIDNNEKTVAITAQTAIRRGLSDIKAADLKQGEQVVVFGDADDQGQIEAKLIRVLSP